MTISVTHGHSLYAFIRFVFLFMVFSILELWCLDSMLVVHLPSCIRHSGIMLPRFHDSSFTYNIWHSAFCNYVASIQKDSEFSFLVRVRSLCNTFLSKFLACNVDIFSDRVTRAYVSVKSKLQHAPSRAYPGHLTPLPSRGGGNLIIRVFQGVGNLIPML